LARALATAGEITSTGGSPHPTWFFCAKLFSGTRKLKMQQHSVHHMFMQEKKNRYAEVANKAKAKRADLDNKTAARKAKALKEDVAQTATRLLRETTKK
jgi:hypothetical protein